MSWRRTINWEREFVNVDVEDQALKYCENHLTFFQVIFEGEIGKGNLGGIAVDDISINNHISQEDCTSKDGFGAEMDEAFALAEFLASDRVCLAI